MIGDLIIFMVFAYLFMGALFVVVHVLRFVFILAPEWLMDQRPTVKRKREACARIMRTYTNDTYADEIPDSCWNTVPLAELVDSEYFDADGYFRRTT